ncbi:Cof-type HAD-IIB family hydrolase [Conexibacter sp. DBS9H8]|uniref:Cof-type HAD-IIB family hydrolase n=1 Tax=Conexibacter sp. DBS9H8 TaxID=2937801 RepID=UPI00200E3032|nr:Cof-type HAD-IIB family hydrolase [Conexibacter sp. DBS9H8]
MPAIRLLLADVDGTLVTSEKELTDAAIAAVHRLHEAKIIFAVTSGRPPRGMEMLVEPLGLEGPIAAFNGGLIVDPQMQPIEQKTIPEDLVADIIAVISDSADAWVYRDADWFIPDPDGAHVARETSTVQFDPTVSDNLAAITANVEKITGVSDDHDAIARLERALADRFGDHVSAARSQPYYVDVTHPQANKGGVVAYLAHHYGIDPGEIATIGDMPNDVSMFTPSGLSIAMGQADDEVKDAATHVTATNDEDGFAKAIDRFILTD